MTKNRLFRASLAIGGLLVLGFFAIWIRSGTMPAAAFRRALTRWTFSSIEFTKEDVVLPITFDKQDHSLSCEVADLKMALAYRGIQVDEAQLLAELGVDKTPKTKKDGKTIWGDPNKAFVGNVDGRMMQNGYGVHWKPIAAVANKYRSAKVIENGTAQEVAKELADGNPVIAWGHLGSGKKYTWQTPDGETINAVYGEHPFLVNGFRGTEDEPTGFFVIDPIYGQKYMTTSAFMKNWASFGHSGVIIY